MIEETGHKGFLLLSELFRRPLINVNVAARVLGVTFPTANRLISRFEELGLVLEVTGQRRSRRFRYEPYLRLFAEPGDTADEPASTAVTEGPLTRRSRSFPASLR